MKQFTEEIFNILSKGGFISNNSLTPSVRKYFDLIEDNFEDYYDYYLGVGYKIEAGNGYFYFSRKESKVDLERKLEAAFHWIAILAFLKTYNSAFGSGTIFTKEDIITQMRVSIELKEISAKLYEDKKTYNDIVEKLISEMKNMAFIELEDEAQGVWKVLSAFHYMEELVDCININEEDIENEPEIS